MKAFKAFIKPFEAPQRSVKIKLKLIPLSEMHGAGKVKWAINLNINIKILKTFFN